MVSWVVGLGCAFGTFNLLADSRFLTEMSVVCMLGRRQPVTRQCGTGCPFLGCYNRSLLSELRGMPCESIVVLAYLLCRLFAVLFQAEYAAGWASNKLFFNVCWPLRGASAHVICLVFELHVHCLRSCSCKFWLVYHAELQLSRLFAVHGL